MPDNVRSRSVKTPRLRRLGVIVAVAAVAGLAFTPSAVAQPYVTISPAVSLSTNVAAPGSTVVVTMTGYDANVTFVITFASQPTQVGSGTTNASGGATTAITVPSDASAGTHEITATDASGASASAAITIEAVSAAAAVPSTPVSGGIAFTGVPVLTVGSLGIALLIAGGFMLRAGRRHKVKA